VPEAVPHGASDLASLILTWHALHGRTGLPWHGTRDPYRVWLSEIMLQQTQVVTVMAYYKRFLDRFPDVGSLATAPQDDVLALWAGLGYYSRARNLHACAKAVMKEHGGQFPRDAASLQSLPGIGRSTAAAIAAFCFGERVAILDGNVKRVLARVLGFDQDLAQAKSTNALWDQATQLLPTQDLTNTMPRHTQAMMDLGATVCTSRKPRCGACPLAKHCVAHAQAREEDYPVKSRKLKRSAESWWLLLARNALDELYVVKRPDKGVWAGLHCLPIYASRDELTAGLTASQRAQMHEAPAFMHVLTHKDLHLHVVSVAWSRKLSPAADDGLPGRWVNSSQLAQLGLPAPLAKLLVQQSWL
jgi:A/G-specific adenine glycosylase